MLCLPDIYTESDAAVLTNEWNRAEAVEMTGFSGSGAWTASTPQPFLIDGSDLSHMLFQPERAAPAVSTNARLIRRPPYRVGERTLNRAVDLPPRALDIDR